MQFTASKLFRFSIVFMISLVSASSSFGQSSDSYLKEITTRNISADDLSGEDLEIRRTAVEALGTAAGTVVVMNVQTGRVYSIVNQQWAIREGFKPCSTIKLVTGVAGVTERLIKTNGDLENGSYRLGLNDSLAYSNNVYFQKVGSGLGSEKMIEYAKFLGLGEPTGINVEDEFAGKLPYGNENPRIYSHADDFEVTPLQLAVMVSALTNGGKLVVPQITKSEYKKTSFRGFLKRNLDIAPSLYERVIPGMIGAADYGTAKNVGDSAKGIAGKTGSCIFDKTWIGLFASVAPIQNPKFAVVVITRGKYARGKYSAAIAGKIYETLQPRFNERFNTSLAKMEPRKDSEIRNTVVVTTAPKNQKPVVVENDIAKNTVITYRRDTADNSDESAVPKKPMKATVIVNGNPEIVRPRVVIQP